MKLKHPLRYYLTKKWVDVGGQKVLYTPANETHFEMYDPDGTHLVTLHIEGGYSLIGHNGVRVETISESYTGEI